MQTLPDRRAELLAQVLRVKGWHVMTSPTASLEADMRARVTSGIEAHFLAKVADLAAETAEGPTYSYTERCYCGQVHPC